MRNIVNKEEVIVVPKRFFKDDISFLTYQVVGSMVAVLLVSIACLINGVSPARAWMMLYMF